MLQGPHFYCCQAFVSGSTVAALDHDTACSTIQGLTHYSEILEGHKTTCTVQSVQTIRPVHVIANYHCKHKVCLPSFLSTLVPGAGSWKASEVYLQANAIDPTIFLACHSTGHTSCSSPCLSAGSKASQEGGDRERQRGQACTASEVGIIIRVIVQPARRWVC